MSRLVLSVLGVILLVSPLGMAQAQEGWEVSGTVTLDSRPATGMSVRVFGGPSSVPAAVTDSRGSYSIKGLVPGQYRIGVLRKENISVPEPRNLSLAGGMRLKVDFRATKGSVISGRVLDQDRRPVPGMIVEAYQKTTYQKTQTDRKPDMRVQGVDRTNDLGEYRIPYLPDGLYALGVHSQAPRQIRKRASDSNPASGRGYPPITFYPGTREVRTAELLDVRGGMERAGFDIFLKQEPTRCLFFKIGKGLAGGRIGAGVRERFGWPSFGGPTVGEARVAAGESYEACGLVPGEYSLSITAYAEGTKEEFPGALELGRNLQILGHQMTTASVGKENVDLGTVESAPLLDVQGTLTIKDAQPGQPIPARTYIALDESEGSSLMTFARAAKIQADGTFALPKIFARDYEARVGPLPGYYLIGAYQNGRSVLDGGFYPGRGDLEVKLGADGAALTGRVLAEDGSAIQDASVFLVPTDPGNHYVVQSDRTGTYSFGPDIPPGRYKLVAAEDLMGWQRTDAATAARLAGQGKELKLDPRESRIMDVKVQPLP